MTLIKRLEVWIYLHARATVEPRPICPPKTAEPPPATTGRGLQKRPTKQPIPKESQLAYTQPNQIDDVEQANPVWNCHRCGDTITANGFITVDTAAANKNRRPQLAATDGVFTDLTEWWDYEPVQWHAYHNHCAPENLRGYDIPIEQLATWRNIVERWAHLATKEWLAETNWVDFIMHAGAQR